MIYVDALNLWQASTDNERRILIADKVLKWRKVKGPCFDYDGACKSYDVFLPHNVTKPDYLPRGVIYPWHYCREWLICIEDAFSLVDFMEKRLGKHGCPEIDSGRLREKGSFFLNGPYLKRTWEAGWMDRDRGYPLVWAAGETKEKAICLVSFLASVIAGDS